MRAHVEIVAACLPDGLLVLVASRPGIKRLRPQPVLHPADFAGPLFTMEPDMLFEGVKQSGDRDRLVISTSVRVDNHMHMVRHDDVPDQADAESLLEYTQSIDHNSFETVVVKER